MRLCDFISAHTEPILMEWEVFARGISSGADMDKLALRDHAQDILFATASDMRSSQTAEQRAEKSKGRAAVQASGRALNGASEEHAIGRLGHGFDLSDVVSEYRALRASVLRLWRDSHPQPDERDVDDLTRFNESIDQSLAKAVRSYTKQVDQARDLFLAILSHDLRNPLNSIAMSASLLERSSEFTAESLAATASEAGTQIGTSAQIMARMISDLLDYTRTRLGAGMPVSPAPMDLGSLCGELFREFCTAHPQRQIRYRCEGDARGEWDADRLRQAISNLMGNALQHGEDPIDLILQGEAAGVVVIVHNAGPPIAAGELSKIFDPLVRGSSDGKPKQNRPGSIGLGLYIAREIAISHGGSVAVTSTDESGTAFTVHLPRHYLVGPGQPILDEEHFQHM